MLAWYREQPHDLGMFYGCRHYSFPELDVFTDSLKEGKLMSTYYQAHYYGVCNNEAMKYFPTIDDPLMKHISEVLSAYMVGFDKEEKAKFLLAFVQQNIRYVSDEDATGERDYWKFPINTFVDREGDCEDMAFLLVSLYHLAGLDAISVWVTKHMTVGVDVDMNGKDTFTHNDTIYLQAEPTGMTDLGTTTYHYQQIYYMEEPRIPTDQFKSRILKERN